MQQYEIQFLFGCLMLTAIILGMLSLLAVGRLRALFIDISALAAVTLVGVSAFNGELNAWVALATILGILVVGWKLSTRYFNKA